MGKHPVSTTIRMELNREVENLCKGIGCSKYAFIEEAIQEKVEKIKNERTQEKERDSTGADRLSQERDQTDRDDDPADDID